MRKLWKGLVGCLSLIGLVIVVGIVAVMFIFSDSKGSDKKSTTDDKVVKVAENTSGKTDEASESKEEVASAFNPTDTSDETINSIKTYGDYLDMYEYVINDYLSYYQSKIEAVGLSDAEFEAEFEKAKTDLQKELDEAEKEYGAMRLILLPKEYGETLTQMLISERDMLRASVDTVFSVYGV